jgi:hypothetical protein
MKLDFFNLIILPTFYLSDLVLIFSINLKKHQEINKLFSSLFFMT